MKVVITGVGMVSPLAIGVEATWRRLLQGEGAIGPIRRFDPAGLPVSFGAEAPDPGWPQVLPAAPLAGDFKARLAAAALVEAMDQAGLPLLPERLDPRLGVCVGSEAGRPPLSALHARLADPTAPSRDELLALAPAMPTQLAAALAGAGGPATTVSTACTSSAQAIGEGLLRIRRGEVDTMIVGGVDVLVDPIMVLGFAMLGALSTRNEAPERASRPFDQDRDGFVLGEGAGFLVLERAEHAATRGARALGVLRGYGCSSNAWRITDSPPDGRGAALSMAAALEDAGLRSGQIGYINAHGTSTPQNDQSESAGIVRVFGPNSGGVPVSSTKGAMGHLVAACGAVEAILCLLAVRDGRAPATHNLDRPGADCPLTHIQAAPFSGPIEHALTNAFGFGGCNASLIVSAEKE